jgi:hypothetical protein
MHCPRRSRGVVRIVFTELGAIPALAQFRGFPRDSLEVGSGSHPLRHAPAVRVPRFRGGKGRLASASVSQERAPAQGRGHEFA